MERKGESTLVESCIGCSFSPIPLEHGMISVHYTAFREKGSETTIGQVVVCPSTTFRFTLEESMKLEVTGCANSLQLNFEGELTDDEEETEVRKCVLMIASILTGFAQSDVMRRGYLLLKMPEGKCMMTAGPERHA